MAYTAYELAAGDALLDVQRFCRHAARGVNGVFTATTVPTIASVEMWLTTSTYMLRGVMRRSGLSDTQTDPAIVGVLQQIVVYDACMKVELALPTEAAGGAASTFSGAKVRARLLRVGLSVRFLEPRRG